MHVLIYVKISEAIYAVFSLESPEQIPIVLALGGRRYVTVTHGRAKPFVKSRHTILVFSITQSRKQHWVSLRTVSARVWCHPL